MYRQENLHITGIPGSRGLGSGTPAIYSIRPPGGVRDGSKIQIPKETLQKSIFSAQDRFWMSKTIPKPGLGLPQNRSKIVSHLRRPESQK